MPRFQDDFVGRVLEHYGVGFLDLTLTGTGIPLEELTLPYRIVLAKPSCVYASLWDEKFGKR